MDPLTIAMVGGTLAQGLGNYLGGSSQADAASKAAQAQAQAAREALEFTKGVYGETKESLSPYIQAGQRGLTSYEQAVQNLTKPDFGYTRTEFGLDKWKDPGYDYRLSEAQKAIEASTASKGMSLGSGALKALQTRSQDMASQEYQNAYERYLKNEAMKYGQASDAYNRDLGFQTTNISNLGNLSNTGLNAAGTLGGFGQQTAQNVGTQLGNIGEANAYGILGPAKAYGDMYGSWGKGISDMLGGAAAIGEYRKNEAIRNKLLGVE